MECYGVCFMQSRQPDFYTVLGVPDTIDGRFDLLLLHEFMIIHRLLDDPARGAEGQVFAQDLFDMSFADMDQSLRSAGIGDMGVPKHIKRMMLAYNGRMHAYEEALKARGKKALEEALVRNLYGTVEKPDSKAVAGMADYVRRTINGLSGQNFGDICGGAIVFAPITATPQ